jgi:N-acetylglutamate synthase-like GNAT family acetyltransferase
MSLKYSNIKVWGRSFAEYVKMFELTANDLRKKIIVCADGPSSFNAAMWKKGKKIISIDPIYSLKKDELSQRIIESADDIIIQINSNKDSFTWDSIKSINELMQKRLSAMNIFLDDYESGLSEKRYLAQSLPKLNFNNKTFDLALCSHFLFLYSSLLSFDFHVQSIKELLRISDEIRIFPIIDFNGKVSSHLDNIIHELIKTGYKPEIWTVDYEFQKGANTMLFIKKGNYKKFKKEDLIIERANKNDSKEILKIQKLAFLDEINLHNGLLIQPFKQTKKEIEQEFEEKVFFKACLDKIIIGSVRVKIEGDTCWVNKLVVHPQFQNHGIAKQLMENVEKFFSPEISKIKLATAKKSDKNVSFYKKIGFTPFRTGYLPYENVEMIFFEKTL